MDERIERLRTMLIQPLRSRLEELTPELEPDEREEFVRLIDEYFGSSVKNRPVRSRFRTLVDDIGRRLAQTKGRK